MINIRPYRHTDRLALREICCNCADRGAPIENFFSDREFAADLLMNYFTDYEPENTLVAVNDEKVVAYINCCLNNRKFGLVMFFIIIPQLLIKGLIRGVYVRGDFWDIVRGALLNWRRLFHWRKHSFESNQGHIHISISQELRGKGVGALLIKELLTHISHQGTRVICASVHEANVSASRFFEKLGFKLIDKFPMKIVYQGKVQSYYSLTYAKEIQ